MPPRSSAAPTSCSARSSPSRSSRRTLAKGPSVRYVLSLVNSQTRGRLFVRPASAALALLLGGCAWDAPMSTVIPRSDVARDILHVYAVITWASVGIALVVFAALGWILARFRDRPGAPLPAQTRGHTLLQPAWTVAPALVLLGIAIPTIQVIFRTKDV